MKTTADRMPPVPDYDAMGRSAARFARLEFLTLPMVTGPVFEEDLIVSLVALRRMAKMQSSCMHLQAWKDCVDLIEEAIDSLMSSVNASDAE